jgi:hypothetical protein
MGDDRSSGSNAGVVIIVALLVLAVPCCGGVALLSVFSYRSVEVAPPQVDVQSFDPTMMPDGPAAEAIAPPEGPEVAPSEKPVTGQTP